MRLTTRDYGTSFTGIKTMLVLIVYCAPGTCIRLSYIKPRNCQSFYPMYPYRLPSVCVCGWVGGWV